MLHGMPTYLTLGRKYTNGELLIHDTNPVPHTYLRDIGAMPLEGIQNIHPRIKHVGSVVRGKQLFAMIRWTSGAISWAD